MQTIPITGDSQAEYKSQGTEGHGLPFVSFVGGVIGGILGGAGGTLIYIELSGLYEETLPGMMQVTPAQVMPIAVSAAGMFAVGLFLVNAVLTAYNITGTIEGPHDPKFSRWPRAIVASAAASALCGLVAVLIVVHCEVLKMSVKVEVIEGGVPHNNILVAGLVSTLVCLYLTYLNVLTGTQLFSFFGGLAVVAALIWGSHTIKVLCSYGIGTGVPSAGMIAFGSGVIAMLLATKFSVSCIPIVALVLAAVIGFILGYVSNNILNMKIPAMVQALTEMAVVGALSLMGFAALITGGFTFAGLTTGSVTFMGMTLQTHQQSFIGGGLIAVAFLLGAIAIQHPFNATLGPGWKQDRMLMLTAECGFLSMIVAAVMSFALINAASALIALIVAIIGWVYTYGQYLEMSKRDAAAWLDSKPIPDVEGH